ncbi:hypothetical protein R3W88_019508 [Solanum pinnatisectum]|uniref:Uncharacterized protein n=1 Tax=Solanum pinnatisectum TaxID=50273 RepID=A0AAV9KK43_9SOLN|nr:hypothetical protein R3W88_019508 [Solanum pinnatisectum]
MIGVIILNSRINQYIINEYNFKHIKVLSKHLINQIHKYRWSISQTKRHHQKLIMTIPGSKSYFRNILFLHPQLVIIQSNVNLREVTRSLDLVK